MNTPLFDGNPREILTVATREGGQESALKEILKKISEVLFRDRQYWKWGNALEARRYQDGRGDPDYERRLRELEGRIDESEPKFRMGDYHEGGGGKWDKWAMPGLVTLAVSGIIGNVVQSMTVSALRQEVTDLKLQVDKIERLVEPRYRGG
jgi:hypothetical protein